MTAGKTARKQGMEKEMRVKTIPGAIRKKEKQAKSFHGVTYPQSCAFCLFLVYKIFFKFGIMPKAGVGVKSNFSLKEKCKNKESILKLEIAYAIMPLGKK